MPPVPPRRQRLGAVTAIALTLSAATWLAGCGRPDRKGPPAYYGPIESLDHVVRQINANNERLDTLYLDTDFDAELVDERGKRKSIGGEGIILFTAPQNLLFRGEHRIGGLLFEIGSNFDRYWLSIPRNEVDTMWWGRYEHLGKPCVEPMPIRPDLILEVLGVSQVRPDLTQLPAPVMRFNHDRDAYMLTWVDRIPDRFVARREIWYDRKTMRPINVLLFDDAGRVLLRAYLADHEQVELAKTPREQWPWVATKYELFFPQSGAKLSLDVKRALKSYRRAPNAAAFRFPSNPGVAKVIQLDERCGP